MRLVGKLTVFVIAICTMLACGGKSGKVTENNEKMSSRDILVVVDLQKDFIDGNLSIPNGTAVVPRIDSIKKDFDQVWFTLDWHPSNHCSFTEYGGIWPVHCLHYSLGASIPDCIMEGLESDKIRFIQKAENPEIEEYGAFANLQPDEEGWFQAGDNVVVCGIASEYCVLETLKNIIRLRDAIGFNVSVFMDGCGCFESQQPLLDFMNEHSVPEYK